MNFKNLLGPVALTMALAGTAQATDINADAAADSAAAATIGDVTATGGTGGTGIGMGGEGGTGVGQANLNADLTNQQGQHQGQGQGQIQGQELNNTNVMGQTTDIDTRVNSANTNVNGLTSVTDVDARGGNGYATAQGGNGYSNAQGGNGYSNAQGGTATGGSVSGVKTGAISNNISSVSKHTVNIPTNVAPLYGAVSANAPCVATRGLSVSVLQGGLSAQDNEFNKDCGEYVAAKDVLNAGLTTGDKKLQAIGVQGLANQFDAVGNAVGQVMDRHIQNVQSQRETEVLDYLTPRTTPRP